MPYAGPTLLPREVAALLHDTGWRDENLIKMTATILGESNGSVGAWHDNFDKAGSLVSRDCGLGQVSIPAVKVGTNEETRLRTDPLYNLQRCRELWEAPWPSPTGIRMFQPWVAYRSGWATFAEWWVYTAAEPRRWAATGRYIHRATVGVANFYAERRGLKPVPLVSLPSPPPKPTEPPYDGVGPRPKPNDGYR